MKNGTLLYGVEVSTIILQNCGQWILQRTKFIIFVMKAAGFIIYEQKNVIKILWYRLPKYIAMQPAVDVRTDPNVCINMFRNVIRIRIRPEKSMNWERLREECHRNIESDNSVIKRQIWSIQTEGHLGNIKGNEDVRRFHYRTSEKVYKEFLLYVMGRNINKYHCFLYGEIPKFEAKAEAWFLVPKIKYDSDRT